MPTPYSGAFEATSCLMFNQRFRLDDASLL